jgi:hypothetical protein
VSDSALREAAKRLLEVTIDCELDAILRDALSRDEAEQERVEISRSVVDVADDLTRSTTDDNPTDVMRRALGLYRTLVQHSQRGGKVVLRGDDGGERVLKIRLRTTEA